MATLTDAQKNVLEQHLASGESVLEVRASDHSLIAVTDRRVIRIQESEKGDRDQRMIKSNFFTGPGVTGVTVNQLSGRSNDREAVFFGSVFVVVGVLTAVAIDSGAGAILGVALSVFGIAALWYGLSNGSSGEIEVVVHKSNDSDVTFDLNSSEAGVASAISESVGAAHNP